MALRDSMRHRLPSTCGRASRSGGVGADIANQLVAEVSGVFNLLTLNRYRIVVITPQRVLILDAGGDSMTTARGVVAQLPRSTRLGPPSGLWHVIPAAV